MSNTPDTDEHARQRALDAYRLVDTLPERTYDDVVELARRVCDAPIALITLLDHERQWFKARIGLEASETPRSVAFCDHAIRTPDQLMEVQDATRDARFRDNPLVTGDMHVRFYAGVPLVTPTGEALGTVCIIDHEPRALNETQKTSLHALARLAVALMEAHRRELVMQRAARDRDFRERNRHDSHDRHDGATQPKIGAVAIVQLDGIAALRDRHGAEAVMQLQIALVPAIQAQLGPRDVVSRHGEHELLLVFSDPRSVAERLASTRRVIATIDGMPGLTASIGAARAVSEQEMEILFLQADDALARARGQGGDALVVVDA